MQIHKTLLGCSMTVEGKYMFSFKVFFVCLCICLQVIVIIVNQYLLFGHYPTQALTVNTFMVVLMNIRRAIILHWISVLEHMLCAFVLTIMKPSNFGNYFVEVHESLLNFCCVNIFLNTTLCVSYARECLVFFTQQRCEHLKLRCETSGYSYAILSCAHR